MRTLTILLLSVFATAACSSESASSSSDDDIIGGVDARGKALDAIGYVQSVKTDGTGGGCTGTLIAPDLVLTAKHCVLPNMQDAHTTYLAAGGRMQFYTGYDARAATRAREVSAVTVCALDQGGTATLGCDVALLRLAQPITDVTPMAVATTRLGPELLGQSFTAVGYGTQDAKSTVSGTRKMASMKLQATTGPGLHQVFPTFDAFAAFLQNAEGAAFMAQAGVSDYYRQRYDLPLLEGYEAQLGGADGNAQVCHGDSGGPLLKLVDGKLTVFGVASTVVGGVTQVCENAGAVYATLGPDAQKLIADATSPVADPCKDVPATGYCNGDVAVRCSNAEEGERRIVQTDCSTLAQRCELSATQPACVD